jgi:hypothetical protein
MHNDCVCAAIIVRSDGRDVHESFGDVGLEANGERIASEAVDRTGSDLHSKHRAHLDDCELRDDNSRAGLSEDCLYFGGSFLCVIALCESARIEEVSRRLETFLTS